MKFYKIVSLFLTSTIFWSIGKEEFKGQGMQKAKLNPFKSLTTSQ